MRLDPEITVGELMTIHPPAIVIFMKRKLACIGCPANTFHTLKDVSRIYGIPLEQLQREILEAICSQEKSGTASKNMAVTDIGKPAMWLVDAETIGVWTPIVPAGPRPPAAFASLLAHALMPEARFLSIIGSHSWASRTVKTLGGMVTNLK